MTFVCNKWQATLWGEVQIKSATVSSAPLLHFLCFPLRGGHIGWGATEVSGTRPPSLAAVAGSHAEPRSQSVGGQEMGFIRPTRRDAVATTQICAVFVIWGEPLNWFSWYCCNCCRRLSNDWGKQLTSFYYSDLGAEKTTATTQSCRTLVPNKKLLLVW